MIFYKGQFVGLAYCEKNKLKGGVIHYINHIFDVNSAKVATVAAEGNQLLIKYTNPYKIVYIKGLQYNKVLYQMVEVDKKLTPKE